MNLHNVSTSLGVSIDAVNGGLNEFFLQMTESLDVVLGTRDLDLRFTSNNTETCARCI